MKKITFSLSDQLYDKLMSIQTKLSIKESNIVTIDEIIEEAILSYFKISLFDLNDSPSNENIINQINKNKNEKKYYVYMFFDANEITNIDIANIHFDYIPFYIGKGKNERYNDINNRDKNLVNHVNNLKDKNQFGIKILIDNLSEIDAYHYEQIFINNFGKLCDGTGILYNKSSGNNKTINNVDGKKIKLNIEYNFIQTIIIALNAEKTILDASKKLNISERTLYRKIKNYSIIKNDQTKLWEIKSI